VTFVCHDINETSSHTPNVNSLCNTILKQTFENA
jgi:hypothetical protein